MKKVYRKEQLQTITLRNANGMEVSIMNFGGIINSIKVPVNGKIVECVLGFDTFEEYVSDTYQAEYPYLGAIIGRNAGRIKYGKVIIEGKEIQLHCNLGENQIHGGFIGFDSVFWEVIDQVKSENPSVTLQYVSKEGEEGYPGEVTVLVTYMLTTDNRLRIDYHGITTAPTILNLTQHTYFNLNENDNNVLNNTLQIKAEKYVPLEEGFFTPTGERPSVVGTPLDYRNGQKVYPHTDNSFVREISADEVMATLINGEETLKMEVRTNHPVLHIYAGYYLPELHPAHRKTLGQNKGICFEAQGYADATKHPQFNNVVLLPNEVYEFFSQSLNSKQSIKITSEKMKYLATKNPFFNVSGLTSSEANYVCERIKERLKPIQDLVSSIETHTSSIDGEPLDTFTKVDDIGGKLNEIGSLYAISAYLRTAIKEKENRLEIVNKKLNEVLVKAEQEVKPIDYEPLNQLRDITIEDYLKTLSLEDMVCYKEAEAKAAHIGKYIHNFDEVRNQLNKKELITFKEVGEQVFKIKNTPLYELSELQQLQEQLLAEHREYESEVNFYKAQFRTYQNNCKLQYEQELQCLLQERQAKVNALVVEKTAELTKLKETIANYRIVVPNVYKETIGTLLKK